MNNATIKSYKKDTDVIISTSDTIDYILAHNDYGFLAINNQTDIFKGIPMIYVYDKANEALYMKYISLSDEELTDSFDHKNANFRLINIQASNQKKTSKAVVVTGVLSIIVKSKEHKNALELLKKKYSAEYIDSLSEIFECNSYQSNIFKISITDLNCHPIII